MNDLIIQIQDFLASAGDVTDVAGGNKPCLVTLEKKAVVQLCLGIFVAVAAAVFVAKKLS
jgi:hypothetical protein